MVEEGRKLYGTAASGHTHRVSLLLTFLGLPYEFVPSPADVRRSAAFREINPLGQIPVLSDGGRLFADSNAILVYLAKAYAPGSHWLPEDAVNAWDVHRWLSIAAGDIRFGPARARLIELGFLQASHDEARQTAMPILTFMNHHLEGRSFLATEKITIADLACYSYIAHAPEGGLPLDDFPHILAWLGRVESYPGFTGMPWSSKTARPPVAR